jgi:hypothetical protein
MAPATASRISLRAYETYTRYFYALLKQYLLGIPLTNSEVRYLRNAENLLDELLLALGEPVERRFEATFGVAYSSQDELDASLVYAFQAWLSRNEKTDPESVKSRLAQYRNLLTMIEEGKKPPEQDVENLAGFFKAYNTKIAAHYA